MPSQEVGTKIDGRYLPEPSLLILVGYIDRNVFEPQTDVSLFSAGLFESPMCVFRFLLVLTPPIFGYENPHEIFDLILPPELFQSIWTSHGDEFATISSQRH
jgi:hypothetical protein